MNRLVFLCRVSGHDAVNHVSLVAVVVRPGFLANILTGNSGNNVLDGRAGLDTLIGGLGTDGNASNNDLDMLGEMRTAALIAKAVAHDASVVSAAQALRMATINGATALGLADTIGSLEIGKAADMIAVDLSALETQPLYDPVSQIVYCANRNQVTHTWVAGKALMTQRELTTLNITELLATAQAWQQKIGATS